MEDSMAASFTDMERRGLYHVRPPMLQTRKDMKPTLLISWWCTGFALAIILVRVVGRYVRTETLFKEDKIMAASIIPLMIRMALVHVILLWGTNNTTTDLLSAVEVHHREIGSRLVLTSRIFYATFIWTAKLTVLEFLKRIVGAYWRKSFELGLQIIRCFLLATYIAVVISTLTECQPFNHYWQVVPDPGPQCREGVVQLMTMGICDIITDLLLVIYPVPIVIMSAMPVRRKMSLILLFALSLTLVALTAYRVPMTIRRGSSQQYRSLLASLEILAAAGVSNSIVIGSFIRDRGVKKAKYRRGGSVDNGSVERTMTRRTTITQNHWGSDSDLVKDLGMCLAPELQSRKSSIPSIPSRPVPSLSESCAEKGELTQKASGEDDSSISTGSTALKAETPHPESSAGGPPQLTLQRLSFFDVGSLIRSSQDVSPPSSSRLPPNTSPQAANQQADKPPESPPLPPQSAPDTSAKISDASLADVGGLVSSSRVADLDRSTALPPAARPHPPPPTDRRSSSHPRNFSRGSSAYSTSERTDSRSPPRQPPPIYHPPRRDSSAPRPTSPTRRTSRPKHPSPPRGVSETMTPWNGAGAAAAMDIVDAGGLLR